MKTFLTLIFFLVTSLAYANNRSADEAFVELRNAARAADLNKTYEWARLLTNYPQRAYVEYYRLRPLLYDPSGAVRLDAPDEIVLNFLQRWKGEAITDRLRNDWLLVLGLRRDSVNFEQQYPLFVLKDDPQVNCYALAFRVAKQAPFFSETQSTLGEAKQWTGDGCRYLLTTLVDKNQLTLDDTWQLMLQAVDQNALSAARLVAQWLPELPENWEKITQPNRKMPSTHAWSSSVLHKLNTLALLRWAREEVLAAAQSFAAQKTFFSVSEQAFLWGQLGEAAARKTLTQAYDYFRLADAAQRDYRHSDEVFQWQTRSALRAGDWAMVANSIEKMSATAQRDSTWTYWLARAYQAQNKTPQAQALWQKIADEFSFYGQLASEELGRRITVPSSAPEPSAEELALARGNPGLQRALKFYELDLRFEGNREWNWQMRSMNDRQLLAAAEFARREQVWDRAINSAERTREQHNFALRFVMPLHDLISAKATQFGLDPAWVFGLIRQESRFILNARSQVGAAGLMQLMPATARQVAHRLGMRNFDPRHLNDIETNLTLGTHYLSTRLDNLSGSYVLASAAYNAGIGRAQQWRSTLTAPIEGAIFAETIPFSETRDYVKKVLSNTVYHALLLEDRPQSLKARLGTIAP